MHTKSLIDVPGAQAQLVAVAAPYPGRCAPTPRKLTTCTSACSQYARSMWPPLNHASNSPSATNCIMLLGRFEYIICARGRSDGRRFVICACMYGSITRSQPARLPCFSLVNTNKPVKTEGFAHGLTRLRWSCSLVFQTSHTGRLTQVDVC